MEHEPHSRFICSTLALALASDLQAMITSAPIIASSLAVAKPIPALPPVIRTVFPFAEARCDDLVLFPIPTALAHDIPTTKTAQDHHGQQVQKQQITDETTERATRINERTSGCCNNITIKQVIIYLNFYF